MTRTLGLSPQEHAAADTAFLRWRESRQEADAREWVEFVQDSLYTLAFRICGDEGLAQDAVQEGLSRAARASAKYRPGTYVLHWLQRIVVNRSVSILKKRRAMATIPNESSIPSRDDPRERETIAEKTELLMRALGELADMYRLPLEVTCVQGLTRQEACKMLGVPAGTFDWRLSEAKKKIRDWFREHGHALAIADVTEIMLLRPNFPVPESLKQGALEAVRKRPFPAPLAFLLGLPVIAAGLGTATYVALAMERAPKAQVTRTVAESEASRPPPLGAGDERSGARSLAAASLPPGVEFHGRVVERAAGGEYRAVPNAKIVLLGESGNLAEARADGDGRFFVAAKEGASVVGLTASADRFRSARELRTRGRAHDLAEGPVELGDLVLLPSGAIEGSVRARDGAPIGEVGVEVTSPSGVTSVAVTSASDGTFLIGGLPPGSYSLLAHAGAIATAPQAVEVEVGKATACNVGIPAAVAHTLRFLFEGDRAPVAGARVSLLEWRSPTMARTTGADGAVTILSEEGVVATKVLRLEHRDAPARRIVEAVVGPAAAETVVEIPRAPRLEVAAFAAETNDPILGIRAELRSAVGSVVAGEAAAGSNRVNLPRRFSGSSNPNETLVVSREGFATEVIGVASNEGEIRVSMGEGGAVEGEVRAADGAPARNERVDLLLGSVVVGRAVTNETGRYRFARAPRASLQVRARGAGHPNILGPDFAGPAARASVLAPPIAIPKASSLRIVREAADERIVSILVQSVHWDSKRFVPDRAWYDDRLEPGGSRVVEPLPEGVFEILGMLDTSLGAAPDIETLWRGDVAGAVTAAVSTKAKYSLHGALLDKTAPMSMLSALLVLDREPWFRRADVDADGTFEFVGLLAGDYDLLLVPRGFVSETMPNEKLRAAPDRRALLASGALATKLARVGETSSAEISIPDAIPTGTIPPGILGNGGTVKVSILPATISGAGGSDRGGFAPAVFEKSIEPKSATDLRVPRGRYRILVNGVAHDVEIRKE